MRRLVMFVAALALMPLALAQPFEWPQDWSTAEAGEASEGGRYRAYAISDPRTFNPFVSAEENDIVDMYESVALFKLDPYTYEFLPYMATNYEASEDGTVFTVDIREGMRFSDGEEITAQDFYTTYLLETDEDVGSNAYDGWFVGDDLIQLEMLDEMTLQFTFPAADRGALATMGGLTPTPDHIFGEAYREGGAEAITDMWGTETDVEEIVSPAPFVPESYAPGERVIFEANEYFGDWNVDFEGNGLPYLQTYQVTIVESTDAALNLYIAGEIDAYSPANLDEVGVVNQAINNGDIEAVLKPNLSPRASSNFIVFNWNKASEPEKQRLFRSSKFRQAMSHLVDREALIDLVYGGAAEPMWTNVYQIFPDWVSPDPPKFPYDPERARELLAELGYARTNDDGILVNADGEELSFTIATNSGNAQREQILQLVVDEAREIGVEIDGQAVEFNLLVDQLLSTGEDRPFDGILIGLQNADPNWPLGANVIPCGTNLHAWNTSGECLTPQETLASELFYEGQQTLDTDEAKQIAYRIQDALAELQAQIFTVSPLSHFSWLDRVGGEHPDDIVNDYVGTRELELTFVR